MCSSSNGITVLSYQMYVHSNDDMPILRHCSKCKRYKSSIADSMAVLKYLSPSVIRIAVTRCSLISAFGTMVSRSNLSTDDQPDRSLRVNELLCVAS